tara:strand:+ start:8664 stop:8891 length:228 start_codon:yes stop_codon:yes gene_type:complete
MIHGCDIMVDLKTTRENFKISTKRKYRMKQVSSAKKGIHSYEDYLIEELIKKHWEQFSHVDYDKLLEVFLDERTD